MCRRIRTVSCKSVSPPCQMAMLGTQVLHSGAVQQREAHHRLGTIHRNIVRAWVTQHHPRRTTQTRVLLLQQRSPPSAPEGPLLKPTTPQALTVVARHPYHHVGTNQTILGRPPNDHETSALILPSSEVIRTDSWDPVQGPMCMDSGLSLPSPWSWMNAVADVEDDTVRRILLQRRRHRALVAAEPALTWMVKAVPGPLRPRTPSIDATTLTATLRKLNTEM